MHRIFRNTLLVGIAEFANKGIIALSTIILVRSLGPEGYGIYSLALTLTFYFFSLNHSGFYNYGLCEIPKNPSIVPSLYNNTIVLRFLLAVVSYLILAGVVAFLDKPYGTKITIFISGVFLFIVIFNIDWVFRGIDRMEIPAISNILQGSTLLFLFYLFVRQPSDYSLAIVLYLLSWVVSIAFSNFFYVKQYGIPKPQLEKGIWQKIIKTSLPTAFALFFVQIYVTISIVILSIVRGDYETGVFSAIQKIASILFLPNGIIQIVYTPELSRALAEGKFHLVRRNYILLKFVISSFLIFGVFGFAEETIQFLYGSNFLVGAPILRILLFSILLGYFSSTTTLTSVVLNRELDFLKVSIIGLVVAVISQSILILNFGMIGAAIATNIVEIIIIVALFIFLRDVETIKDYFFGIKPIVIAIICMIFSKLIAFHTHPIVGIFSYSLFYLVVVFSTKLVTIDTIGKLLKAKSTKSEGKFFSRID